MTPSSLVISRTSDNDWSVWMSLPDHDPIEDAFGFVVGSGETREEAVADAVAVLQEATRRLQAPACDIEERDIS
jgi:hypothetical protein